MTRNIWVSLGATTAGVCALALALSTASSPEAPRTPPADRQLTPRHVAEEAPAVAALPAPAPRRAAGVGVESAAVERGEAQALRPASPPPIEGGDPDPARVDAAGDGRIVITEVMVNPSALTDEIGEYFEIYNPSNTLTYNLNGWKFEDNSTPTKQTITISSDFYIYPHQYLVFAATNNLGNAAYGVTADYVYTQSSFQLGNTSDAVKLVDNSGTLVASVVYSATGTWPIGNGPSMNLGSVLVQEAYSEDKTYWCSSSSFLTGASGDKGTPRKANDACANIDTDKDGLAGADDPNDSSFNCWTGNVEVVGNSRDEDCDTLDLKSQLTDPANDSTATGTELTAFAATWSGTDLVFSFDHTMQERAVMWLFDTGVSGGETNFNASAGYGGAFPTNVQTSAGIDFMVGTYGKFPLYAYRVVDNSSSDISTSMQAIYKTNYLNNGTAASGYVRLSWDTLYGLGAGVVPVGAKLQIVGAVRAGDNTSPDDLAPNNSASPITTYLTLHIDANRDGAPDSNAFTDGDTDGFTPAQGDCNDSDAQMYPGLAESCDGKDNNCDGTADNGAPGVVGYRDVDGDGFGDAADSTTTCPLASGYVTNDDDCDDTDAAVKPGATEICDGEDNDCDGQIDEGVKTTFYDDDDADTYGDPADSVQACSAPAGYVGNNQDCDDTAAAIKPGATEVCDGVDNDCDTQIDEGVGTVYYQDSDSDGFGSASSSQVACAPPSGYVTNSTDCDDTDANIKPGATELTCDGKDNDCAPATDDSPDADADTFDLCATGVPGADNKAADCDDSDDGVYPGATETCDGVDDDCDGQIDDGVKTTYYDDDDGDTYGDPADTTQACSAPSGYVSNNQDCDDTSASIKPGATETCNTKDDDCDGQIDEGVKTTFYDDDDADTYGDPADTTQACSAPSGYVSNNQDCDDTSASIKPGATETCNLKDDDCDTQIDEGVKTTFYDDDDGDTYGDPADTTQACSAPSGYVANNQDCDDTSASIKPGATETCNGKDDDCDTQIDESVKITYFRDQDGDGYGTAANTTQACSVPTGYAAQSGDCDDANNTIHPGATEVCNSKDDDCDTQIDESVQTTWYRDADSDTYGNPSVTQSSCSQPSGYVSNNQDCNDSDATVKPGATEVCDGKDNDCNGSTDPATSSDAATWYRDSDADNYGVTATTVKACSKPSGYTSQPGDCNDTDAAINPGATEVCDGKDNNCDGSTDPTNSQGVPTWYLDFDADGYGGSSFSSVQCNKPSGYVNNNTDCNDADNTVYPGAPERCDGKDNDCDAVKDEAGAVDESTWYADNDGDGFGKASQSTKACNQPSGYVSNSTDCDDTRASVKPGATEICDGLDTNCDGTGDATTFDVDKDNHLTSSAGCPATVSGKASDDCNDSDAAVYPGAPLLCDGKDNDCDALGDKTEGFDEDGDNHLDEAACSTGDDCDDSDPDVYTGAGEVCNGLDDDCDGTISDEQLDTDGDGFKACPPSGQQADCDDNDNKVYPGAAEICDGKDNNCDASVPANEADKDDDEYLACAQGSRPADCDDNDPVKNPGGVEICDTKDNDCDGTVDDGVTTTYYRDGDQDSAGDPTQAVQACSAPTGYVRDNADCDDKDPEVYGGNTEVCDGKDNNCNDFVDEGFDKDSIGGPDCDDLDEDGFTEDEGDCNDANVSVYPDADEDPIGSGSGDNLDNNCDGQIDEGTLRFDDDGDGYCESSSCVGGDPGGDCDDEDADINPGEQEVPGNSVDENCDAASSDVDGDGFTVATGDCDDEDPQINPDALEIPGDLIDEDCDGVPNDVDGDGFDSVANGGGDCDDDDPDRNPGLAEVGGNEIDEDCSGEANDLDGDGADSLANGGEDCDDGDAEIYPGAEDVLYDSIDQDCSGKDDADKDNDGECKEGLFPYDYSLADCAAGTEDCNDADETVNSDAEDLPGDNIDQNCDEATFDVDGDGFGGEDDCDDADSDINPDADEVAYDEIDQDCDGFDLADVDGDGYCADLSSYDYDQADCADGSGDCDDDDDTINPGADDEGGDEIDQDCDGAAYDVDGDGVGADDGDCDDADPAINPTATDDPGDSVDEDCDGRPYDADGDGYDGVEDADCNDGDAAIHPEAEDVCGNGIDEDCDLIDAPCDNQDLDGDGIQAAAGDCDDSDAEIYPGAAETCGDTIDNNCNGATDEACSEVAYFGGCSSRGGGAVDGWWSLMVALVPLALRRTRSRTEGRP